MRTPKISPNYQVDGPSYLSTQKEERIQNARELVKSYREAGNSIFHNWMTNKLELVSLSILIINIFFTQYLNFLTILFNLSFSLSLTAVLYNFCGQFQNSTVWLRFLCLFNLFNYGFKLSRLCHRFWFAFFLELGRVAQHLFHMNQFLFKLLLPLHQLLN